MNLTKADMKDLYFKRQDVFPFEKSVNQLKECYNTLGYLEQTDFEVKKVQNMLDHINFLDAQVKACINTARKYLKDEFSGACTYLTSKVACDRIHNSL